MPLRLAVLNGPNLNLLGEREPEIYGSTTLAAVEDSCREFAGVIGAEVNFAQTNYEGMMVDWIQEARLATDALIINPAGFSFHSIPVLDALRAYPNPIIELYISNIHARDEQHRHSIVSKVATGVICGLGVYGYTVAMQAAARMAGGLPDDLPTPIRIGPT